MRRPKFTAQETRRMIEPLGRGLYFLLIAEQREENLGVTVIGGHFDVRQGHHADARILDLETDQVGQFALDLFGHTQGAGEIAWHVGGGRVE